MNIKIATAPVSWGVIMKDTPNVPPWETVLKEMSEAGYTGTELDSYGFIPQDTAVLKPYLEDLGLTVISAFVQINLVEPAAKQDKYDESIATSKVLSAMNCEWVVLSDALFVNSNRAARAGRIRAEDGLSGDDWRNLVANANAYGKLALEEYGLKAVFHPHVGSFIETAEEVNHFLNDTNSDHVNLCLDTAHSMYGGDDPIACARRWGRRLTYLHLKECDQNVLKTVRANEWDYFKAVESDVFPELGKGSIDFSALLEVLEEIDFEGWAIVQQDILPDSGLNPLESSKRNLAFLRELGYV